MTLFLDAFPRAGRRPPWGIAASAGGHLVLVVLVVVLSVVRPLAPPPPLSITVELVPPPTQGRPAHPLPAPTTPSIPDSAPVAAPTPRPATTGKPPGAPAPAMIHAKPFFAAAFLKDPANARLKKTLSSFADSEKIVQLCNMEGIEQIRRANPKFDPDVLVSYALSDFVITGLTLTANGGAFHSGRSWTALRLACTVTPDYAGVAAFDFAIGAPIPKAQWASHNLPEQYEDSD